MATLRIKNVTDAELKIETGGAPVTLAANEEKELSEKDLMSRGFAKAIEAGSVSFVIPDDPGQDQIELARKVLPPLVTAMRDGIGNHKNRFEQSQRALLQLREPFNKAWKIAKAHLEVAQTSTSGWLAVKQAVQKLLLDTQEEDSSVKQAREAVESIEQEIDELKNEDLAATGRSLEEWFADRFAKEQALKEAQEALAKVSAEKTDPLAIEVASVDGTVAALTALTEDKAIGKEIAEFGK
jgi:hypothetical protein